MPDDNTSKEISLEELEALEKEAVANKTISEPVIVTNIPDTDKK